jgi:hypothetical protein
MFEYWQDAGARKKSGGRKRSSSKVGTTKRLSNGAVGTWKKVAGKTVFRITKGMNAAAFKKKVSSKRGKRTRMTPRAAKMAMTRYYNKRHSSPRARAIAIGRDMCGANKPVTTSTKYRRSPLAYDFRGLDDGSNCAHSPTRRRRKMSPKAKAVLVARLAKGRAKSARKSPKRKSPKRKSPKRKSGRGKK